MTKTNKNDFSWIDEGTEVTLKVRAIHSDGTERAKANKYSDVYTLREVALLHAVMVDVEGKVYDDIHDEGQLEESLIQEYVQAYANAHDVDVSEYLDAEQFFQENFDFELRFHDSAELHDKVEKYFEFYLNGEGQQFEAVGYDFSTDSMHQLANDLEDYGDYVYSKSANGLADFVLMSSMNLQISTIGTNSH
jgi:hypothetical protein